MADPLRIAVYAVIAAIALGTAVARPISQSVFGDDRLSGVVMASGFSALWLANLWLNVRYYGSVGAVTREQNPAAYWGCFIVLLLIGFLGIGFAVVLFLHGPWPSSSA